MNNQQVSEAIVLARTDYGEADRIITLLTPQAGKLRLMAKGVRRIKSKLAGGIELFSVTNVTYLRGRGDIGTLISSRLVTHYGHIIEDIERTMLGYELIRQLNKATEDEPEPEYFHLLQAAFEALDDSGISLELVRFWFASQLLRLNGHSPNLQTDVQGEKLVADGYYNFDFEHMAFVAAPEGRFTADHIKVLRLAFSANAATILQRVANIQSLLQDVRPLISQMAQA